jgi:hypothetical protein
VLSWNNIGFDIRDVASELMTNFKSVEMNYYKGTKGLFARHMAQMIDGSIKTCKIEPLKDGNTHLTVFDCLPLKARFREKLMKKSGVS